MTWATIPINLTIVYIFGSFLLLIVPLIIGAGTALVSAGTTIWGTLTGKKEAKKAYKRQVGLINLEYEKQKELFQEQRAIQKEAYEYELRKIETEKSLIPYPLQQGFTEPEKIEETDYKKYLVYGALGIGGIALFTIMSKK